MKTKNDPVNVLTDEKIKQKMAGYKSNYTKLVKNAKTAKERKELEKNREVYLAERLAEIISENQHQIRRRAAMRAWETIRKNKENDKKDEPVLNKKSRSTKVGISIINK